MSADRPDHRPERTDVFGKPFDLQPYLEDLSAGRRLHRVWATFWERLHHQGSLVVASYEACAAIVEVLKVNDALGWNPYAFLACVATERHRGSNPQIPGDLEAVWNLAWREVVTPALRDLGRATDPTEVRAVMAVIAAAKGRMHHAEVMLRSDEEVADMLGERRDPGDFEVL